MEMTRTYSEFSLRNSFVNPSFLAVTEPRFYDGRPDI
jgi:hypothetical protein